jgi:hypothetical protein
MEYYTINYMFRPLYIAHPQVFLKLIELLYKQYGGAGGGGKARSRLQYWVGQIRIITLLQLLTHCTIHIQ